MNSLIYIQSFIKEHEALYQKLINCIVWDERMTSRKTASFGKAYNYSQIHYEPQPFLDDLIPLLDLIHSTIGFQPNNCLINYYPNGKSKMGWHSDQIDILVPDTGIAIISLGAERILKFRNILDQSITQDYLLASGSLAYMNQDTQKEWQHTIPKTNSSAGRLSLTFRALK
ncbi:alpha-ketoglutarate-dependent dioxygenase AlkB [Acinetobacter venetianus]|uniref:alpha-ketoglutarate-dependent dioxygenase AlkB n=1 Tax=Acinetobacter venetianus TaxID=52133 RepID=UPI00077563FE|nr:alpha-ketoglutarate-dependent dioxygenase AlkB [Acinetobacter venetianus]KXO75350.1 2OG-Fe(II) oxygenase [Acinetobacter venetianus]